MDIIICEMVISHDYVRADRLPKAIQNMVDIRTAQQ